MASPAERFAIIADASAKDDGDNWIVSMEAETLDAARGLERASGPPKLLSRSAFDGERLEPTLLFLPSDRGVRPVAASIWRLTSRSDTKEDAAPRSPDPGPMTEQMRLALKRAGVAESDVAEYSRLQTLGFIGSQLLSDGRYAEAEPLFVEALDLARGLDHPESIVKAQGSLGMVRMKLGRLDAAIDELGAALERARRYSLTEEARPTKAALIDALSRAGRHEEARHLSSEFSARELDRSATDGAVSHSVRTPAGCVSCATQFYPELFILVDEEERPDLIGLISKDIIHCAVCPECKTVMTFGMPLLIFRPRTTPKLILSPTPKAPENIAREQSSSLLSLLAQKLGDGWRKEWVSDGVLTVECRLLGKYLEADLDLVLPSGSKREVMERAVEALLFEAEGWAGARRVVEDHPVLCSVEALLVLDRGLQGARRNNDWILAHSTAAYIEILSRCLEVGVDAAFEEVRHQLNF